MTIDNFYARRKRAQVTPPVPETFPAQLGDGTGNLFVTGKPNYVYARVNGRVEQVFNNKVPPEDGLQVIIGRDTTTGKPGLFQVLSTRTARPGGVTAGAVGGYAPASRYQLFGDKGGQDPLWVRPQQILGLRVSGSSGLTIKHDDGVIHDGSGLRYIAAGTIDMTALVPAGAGDAVIVLVYVDNTGAVTTAAGSTYTLTDVTTPALALAEYPTIPADCIYPLAFVRLYNGQIEVKERRTNTDITDARWNGLGGQVKPFIGFGLTAAHEVGVGQVAWNADDETLDVGLPDDVTGQMFLEEFFDVNNQTGATLTNGMPVMFAGTLGASGRILAQPAIADGTLPPEYTIGIVTHDIPDGEMGKVTWRGKVRKIDTTGAPYGETWADGDLIYISPTTAGYLTNERPEAPDRAILIAAVIFADDNNGTLLVRPTWTPKLTELDDVDGVAPVANDILKYDGSVWQPSALTDIPIPSGATLPASPADPSLFLHTPTGRTVLLSYSGGTWTPLYSFGTMTIYVDGTLGTDAPDNGFGVGADAYKTLNYAWSQIPSTFYGNVTLNAAAGTYLETFTVEGKRPGGPYGITVNGELTTVDSGTVTGGVQGATTTLGTLQDTSKTWTVNEHKGRLALIGTTYRVIQSNTADTLTIVGYWASAPSGAYSILTQGTILTGATNSLVIGDYQKTTLNNIKFTGASAREIVVQNKGFQSATYLNRCWVDATASEGIYTVLPCFIETDYCYLSTTNSAPINITTTDYSLRGCYIYRRSGTRGVIGLATSLKSSVFALGNALNYFENFATGISIIESVYDNLSMYQHFADCDTGVGTSQGGQVRRNTNHVYIGCTTNENSGTATFGAVGTPSQYLFSGNVFADGNADEIQLRVQAHSTQTANIATFETSAAGVLDAVSPNGKLILTPSTSTTFAAGDQALSIVKAYTLASGTGTISALSHSATVTPTTGTVPQITAAEFTAAKAGNGNITSTSSYLRGALLQARTNGSTTGNFQALVGGYFTAVNQSTSGTVAQATGGYFLVNNTSTGTITNAIGAEIESLSNASGTVTNNYGIKVNDQTAGTNNFAIQTNAGQVVFNEGGDAASDLRAESDTETDMLFLDASADALYLGGSTNGVKITKGGELTLIGTATRWDDLRIEPVARNTGTKAAPFTSWKGGLYLYDFDDAVVAQEKEIFFNIQMSHAWKEGSTIYPHVHWIPKTAGTAGNAVRWGFEYVKAAPGATFGTSTTVYAATAGTGDITVADDHMITDLTGGTGIDMTGDTLSTVIVCRLFRNSSNAADTYTGTAGLLYIDVHHEIDSMGSSQEYIK